MRDKYKLLIDGDLLVYRAAFAAQHTEHQVFLGEEVFPVESFRYKKDLKNYLTENKLGADEYSIVSLPIVEPVANALHSIKHMINSMLGRFNTKDYVVYITGKGNYREDIFPEYKANRKDMEKPVHYEAARNYLIDRWNAEVIDGMEADDALGLAQQDNTIIASIDKDLDCVPGWHYNFVKDVLYEVETDDADYFFFRQLLTGDATDNIPGLPGVGNKTADKILAKAYTIEEMFEKCKERYKEEFGEGWNDRMELIAQLVWIRQMREIPLPKRRVYRQSSCLWPTLVGVIQC